MCARIYDALTAFLIMRLFLKFAGVVFFLACASARSQLQTSGIFLTNTSSLAYKALSEFVKVNHLKSSEPVMYFDLAPGTNAPDYLFVTTPEMNDGSADRAPDNSWDVFTLSNNQSALMPEPVDFNFGNIMATPPLDAQQSSEPFYLINCERFPNGGKESYMFYGLQKNKQNNFEWFPLCEWDVLETDGVPAQNGMEIIFAHLKTDTNVYKLHITTAGDIQKPNSH